MSYRILIADDDLHTRKILETLFAREPSLKQPEIVCAADGQEAMVALERGRPDLVITDLLMPRMDGFAFARALRKHPNGASVPLLVTSAIYKDKVALSRLEQETSCEFFAKPYQLRELVRAVLRLLVEPNKPRPPSRPREPGLPSARAKVELPTSGSLEEKGVARLLLEKFDAGATGVLQLVRAKVKKDIFILLGHPISADSNLRNETLGQLLLARGALDRAKLAQALELSQSGSRLGAVLVEKGWMKESEVLKYLAAQVRLKIVNALRWREGTFRFTPGDTFSGRLTHLTVNAPQLVFSGLKRTANLDEIARAAAAQSGRLVLDPRFERYREVFAQVFGPEGLSVLGDRPRPAELVARGDGVLLIEYDALLVAGLASLSQDGVPERAREIELSAGTLAGGSREASLYQQLFSDDEISGLRNLPSAAPSVDLNSEDSGVFALPRPGGSEQPAKDPALEAAREALLREYLALPTQDHYQLLRVARTAAADEIERAFAVRADEFRLERFRGIDLGRDYDKLEQVNHAFQEAYEVLSEPVRRELYDRWLASGGDSAEPGAPAPGSSAAVAGERHFREGVRLLGVERRAEAVERLREAVRAAPEEADYHAVLGWAIFQARGAADRPAPAAAEAWAELEHAFAIDPDNAPAHEFAGRIAFVLGDDPRAAEHLERALHLDPSRTEALKTVEAVHLRRGSFERLERLYRALISRLGDARAASIWWDLAVLLRDHMGNRNEARVAMATYCRLVPEDAHARDSYARLQRPTTVEMDSGDWRKIAATLRTVWNARPSDPSPGRDLFRFHLQGERPDAALAAACALIARGAEDDEVLAFVRRYHPRFLQRAIAPIAWGHVDAIRHPDDDRDLATLYTRLFNAAPPAVEDPAPDAERLPTETLPPTFVQVLGYAAWVLGVAPPTIARAESAGSTMGIVPLSPPLLLVGPDALAITDKLALAFHLGRALSTLYPARAFATELTSRELKNYLAGAMSLAYPSWASAPNVADADEPEVRRLRDRFDAVPQLAAELSPILSRLATRGTALNLSRWVRGIARTSERIGLVVSGDLPTAVRALAADGASPTVIDDLIDFSLSDELAGVRQALGLTVAV